MESFQGGKMGKSFQDTTNPENTESSKVIKVNKEVMEKNFSWSKKF